MFFADSQVTFAYLSCVRPESALQPHLPSAAGEVDQFGLKLMYPRHNILLALITPTPEKVEFVEFKAHIGQYTRRSLSRPEDGVNAIRAVLERAPYHTYVGIPFLPSWIRKSAGFCCGLLWGSRDSSSFTATRPRATRRKEFPSWS